jgi:hypothetical protein
VSLSRLVRYPNATKVPDAIGPGEAAPAVELP